MAAGDDGADGANSASDADLARRLDRLSRDLENEKRERAASREPPRSDNARYALAFRLASEFVAGVVIGAVLGWGLDTVAGTSPWGLIGLLLLGFCAGVLNVVRAAGRMSTPSGASDEGRGE